MNKRTKRALLSSIAHWKRLASGKTRGGEEVGARDCALCLQFMLADDLYTCAECPVRQRTGYSGCKGTPYRDAERMFIKHGADSADFKAAAKVELKFLQSLLPKDNKKGKTK